MSSIGAKIDEFDVPVCNSFEARILNDQLCYGIDLDKFSNKNDIEQEIKLGFTFIMDYNEDRQIAFGKYQDNQQTSKTNKNMMREILNSELKDHALIILDTIGR